MTTLTIKKDLQDLHSELQSLVGKKLSQKVLDDITARFLATKNSNGSGSRTTAYYDENRNLVAVFCYYHKCWELVDHIEYGNKAGTKTGLNTMCKEGVSAWTKANRQKTKAKDDLLSMFTNGQIDSDVFKHKLSELDEPQQPEPHSDEEHSFATIELLEAHLAAPVSDSE
jgi:hypothetical protein